MNMTEKNGQPSMEEILASIRRIIAEEPANQAHGDIRGGQPIVLKGDGVLDDAGDFDLPAIFRSSTLPAADRPAPLLGRLTDAIRNATTAQPEGYVNGESLVHANGGEANGAAPAEAHQSYQGLSSLQSVRPEGPRVGDAAPMNGSGHVDGHAHYTEPSAQPSQPLNAASTSDGPEPKRVMAPFKDTHFMRMSAPPAGAAPMPERSEPAAAPPAPPTDGVPPAPLPAEHQPPLPPVAAYVEEVPEVAPAAAAAPQVVAMPPPPLPETALPAADTAEGVGSIEDTTADLLRPMLRQWLADNMPRMVEKALHIEIAESVKPPKKP